MSAASAPDFAARRRRAFARPLLAMTIVGCLLLAAAVTTLVIPLVWSYQQWRAYLDQERIDAVVVTGQVAPQSNRASLLDPWSAEYRPEILVRYAPPGGGEAVELWLEVAPDLPTMDVWEAHARLEKFTAGQRVVLCPDAEDPTELRLDPGHRSWQPAVLGGIVAILVAMPGVGLILAAWLLRKLACHRNAEGAPRNA